MVGKLLYLDDKHARTSFLIDNDNVFVKNGFFQEAGLMENIAQSIALGAGYLAKQENKEASLGFIGAVRDLEVFNLPKAGDELATEVTLENQIFNVSAFSAKVYHNETLIAQCQMKIVTVGNNEA